MTGLFFVIEVAGAALSNSLALLSDAGHMLSDVAALSLALVAMMHMHRPPDVRRSFGYRRLEIVSALANGALLCLVAIGVGVEAYRRFQDPPEVRGSVMLWVAAAGLAVNGIAIALLHGAGRTSLGIRGALFHVIGDALGSLAALVAAVVLTTTGWTRIDPLASAVIAVLLVVSGWHLIRESLHILIEGVPRHIDLPEVEAALGGMAGIDGVHDLHVWRIGSDFDTLTVHLVVADPGAGLARKEEARTMLRTRYGIHHCTIEVEDPGERARSHGGPGSVCERDQRDHG
jgi:cobalt-zinc-cadmium efflux system protein